MLKKIKKNSDLIIRIYATFSLLLNLTFPLWTSPRVYAQEVPESTESIEVKEEVVIEEEKEVEAVEEEEVVIVEEEDEVVEEEIVIEGEITEEAASDYRPEAESIEEPTEESDEVSTTCLSEDTKIRSSKVSDWEIDGVVAETKDDVELGVRYEFPLDKDVTVTFNCLPQEEYRSHLKIERIDISELDLPEGFETDAPYAYDITTEMENGTFEYEITLPKFEEDVEAEIVYIEESANEVKNKDLKTEDIKEVNDEDSKEGDDKVKAKGLDHFTVYIPITSSSGTKPSVNIDQCENGGVAGLPGSDKPCENGSWVNGNVNESKAHYYEDDSIPYRAIFDNLTDGANYTFTIEWDSTKGGKHAIDYLTSFDRTETDADPCSDIFSNCPGTPNTYPIPPDSVMEALPNWNGTADYGNFSIYNGTITSVSSYNNPSDYTGDSSTSITINFTADENDWVVIAWGGHISSREDWGEDNSAIAISGSPYHMRTLDFTCSNVSNCGVGNQDLSLSASAVIFPGSITIVKEATPESSQQFNFTGDLGNFSLVDNGGTNSTTFSDIIDFTTYSVTESALPGWSLTNLVCTDPTSNSTGDTQTRTATINLAEGENIACTFTNEQQEAYLTVVKTVVNDNGGTLTADDFNLYIDGSGVTNNTATLVTPGAHTVSEDPVFGYAAGTWGGDCDSNGNVTVLAGESKTCTITNDDIQPLLTVTKIVVNDNGGTLGVSDFPLFVDATSVTSGDQNGFDAGSYVVSETEDSGYTATISGDCDANGNVSLSVGDVKSCTITNNDIGPTLTLVKTVVNDNGGTLGVSDFNLYIDGNSATSGVAVPLSANVEYTASEDNVYGYAASDWGGDCAADGTITLSPGQNATCTITNNDIQPLLTVTKIVVNDNGGTLGVSDFPLFVDATSVTSGDQNGFDAGSYAVSETEDSGYTATISGDCDSNGNVSLSVGDIKSCTITNDDIAPTLTLVKVVTTDDGGDETENDFQAYINGNPVDWGVAVTLVAGNHTASEDTLTGYTPSDWTGDCNADGTITLGPGENKTCTITNDDIAPKLTLVKNVLNDNGGNAQPDDFNLTIGGNPATSGVSYTLAANAPYIINETQLSGYDFVSITGDAKCPQVLGGTVTLDEGDNITCTITNDDQAASITLIKNVINDNGGNAQPNDFNLSVGGLGVQSGVKNNFNANQAYALSEVQLSGYSFVSITGDAKCPNTLGGTVTLDEGEDITCTITNDDDAPTITLIKNVVNDNGGNAQPNDFNLTVGGVGVLSGVTNSYDANTSYALNETLVDGYSFVSITGDAKCPQVLGGAVTLDEGEDITCTITNDDDAPTITLIKEVVNDNGGNAQPNDFNLTVGGVGVLSGVTNSYDANTSYALNETQLSGYSFVSITGDAKCPQVLGGTVTLDEGEDITCTITNDDDAPTITLIKEVVNDNGGNAQPNDFNLTVGGVGVLSGVTNSYDANTSYALNETLVDGYSFVSITGDAKCPQVLGGTVTLDEGEDITCTITNDDIQPLLTVTKVVASGDAQVNDFDLFVGNTQVTSGVQNGFTADTYIVSESPEIGYTGVISGDCDARGNVTLNVGDVKECTITNTRDLAKLTILKNIDWDESGQIGDHPNDVLGSVDWTWDIENGEQDISTGDTRTLPTGDYVITEDLVNNYHFVSYSCDDGSTGRSNNINLTLDKDDEITCTITNAPDKVSVSGYKFEDLNGDGVWDINELGLAGWTISIYEEVENSKVLVASTTTDENGFYEFDGLTPDTYFVAEELQTGWIKITPATDYIGPIVLGPAGTSTDNNFGNFKLVTLSGYKWYDTNGDGIWDENEDPINNWTIYLDGTANSVLTDVNGYYEFTDLGPGTYLISETVFGDWVQTFPVEPSTYTVTTESGVNLSDLNFGNVELSDIHGIKWNDINKDGIRGCFVVGENDSLETSVVFDQEQEIICEDVLGNWTIFIDENGNEELDEGETYATTESDENDEHFGWYWFEDLLPGEYTVCEVIPTGWSQTYPFIEFETTCHTVSLPDSNPNNFEYLENRVTGPVYDFGNVADDPELTVSKENDTGGAAQSVGATVNYTIVVTATSGDPFNVVVTDLLPEGFRYVQGSWGSSSSVRGDLKVLGITTEPTYASPGDWNLGDMVEGEVVTLTFSALIESIVDAGLYKDLVWAQGENVVGDQVLATAVNPGFVDENFAGTEVLLELVVDPDSAKADIDVEEEIIGEVLGASTFLPATGSNTNLIYIALVTLLIGLLNIALALVIRKGGYVMKLSKTIFALTAVVVFSLSVQNTVLAAGLNIRLEEPNTAFNEPFDITFVALDILDREVDVECFVKKPSSGSFIKFGTTISLPAGGDTDVCSVGNSVLTENGTYVFKTLASAGSDTDASEEVSVSYDSEGPERPKYIDVDKKGSCKYEIEVKTHSDGDTTYIEVYASDEQNYSTNETTRIRTINVGPDEKVEFTYELYGSECGKKLYFSTRAFDSAGNPSKVRNQEITETKTVTTTETTTEEEVQAIPVSSSGGGDILGIQDQDAEEEQGTPDDGDILGEDDEDQDETDLVTIDESEMSQGLLSNLPWWMYLILILLGIFGFNAIRNSKNKE